jgi:hypothetical protein
MLIISPDIDKCNDKMYYLNSTMITYFYKFIIFYSKFKLKYINNLVIKSTLSHNKLDNDFLIHFKR